MNLPQVGQAAATAGCVTAVEMFYDNEELTLFVLRADLERPQVATVRVPLHELRSVFVQFYKELERLAEPARDLGAITSPAVSAAAADALAALGSWIWEPVRRWVQAHDLVVWIPYGVFHALPLHLVPAEDAPLIVHHPIAYAPSAAVLQYCQQKNSARSAPGYRRRKQWWHLE